MEFHIHRFLFAYLRYVHKVWSDLVNFGFDLQEKSQITAELLN